MSEMNFLFLLELKDLGQREEGTFMIITAVLISIILIVIR